MNEPASEDASLYQRWKKFSITFIIFKFYFCLIDIPRNYSDLKNRLNHISSQSIKTFKHYLKIKETGAEPLEKDLVKYQKYTEIGTLRTSILSLE